MAEAAAVEAAEDTDAPIIEGADDQQQQSEATPEAVEAEARKMGWDPAKGPLTADEYIKRGNEIGGFVKKHNEKLQRDLDKANAKLTEMGQTLEEAKTFFSKTEKRAYEAAKRDIEARLDAAVDAGDQKEVRELTREAAELEADTRAPKADPNAQLASARDAWISDNPWFENDPDLRAFAIGVGEDIKATIEPLKQFAEITRRVKARFPEAFGNPRRAAPAAVEGASNRGRTATKGWADLPPEAKAQADRFIKDGYVKDRAAYAAAYDFGA